ncbi:MAG: serpin family protein [Clostridiales bacterium]|nr:serpin family protein [Clostridiales bacterium]
MKHTRLTAVLLLGAILFGLMGCADGKADPPAETLPQSTAPTEGIAPSEEPEEPVVLPEDSVKEADFAVRLFQRSLRDGENTLVSPLSVFSALAMTMNGARGRTLEEMEAVLGMSAEGCSRLTKAKLERMSEATENLRFHLANAIWFTDDERFTVNADFLETSADRFGAGIYRASFDETTAKEINSWVRDNTDGMIPAILDRIPEEAVMFLVNALAFEGEWLDPYFEFQVSPGDFTREDGEKETVDFMHREEHTYLEDGDAASGFIKYYKGGRHSRYAFAALLPKEGTSVSDYAASLTGERLLRILSTSRTASVETAMPKFQAECGTDLSEVLAEMGMPTAFDLDNADFTGLGTSTVGNIGISRVLHKTFIAVDELGTKAGAATAVDAAAAEALITEKQRVILDRPFVYMLIDCETNVPFFLGTLMSTAE